MTLVSIEPARASDREAVEELVAAASLPPDEIAERLDDFRVARDGGVVVGCVGLEAYGCVAVLRSLAVLPTHRNRGLGRRLALTALADARVAGIKTVVCLTLDAAAWFEKLGFRSLPRDSLPARVSESWQFRKPMCESARCLAIEL